MSDKSHNAAIGAFVIGAILIAITMVIFALGTGFGRQSEKVVMVFEGSVKGLKVGAPVALRGVQIGQVTAVELMLNADNLDLTMLVEAELSSSNIKRLGTSTKDVTDGLIARGLRAQLKTQSLLTGLLYIQLDFHPDKPPVLAQIDSELTQIPTIPTDLEQIARKIEEIDLAQLAQEVQDTIRGLSSFVTSDKFQSLSGDLQTTLASVTRLSDELNSQLVVAGPKLDSVLNGASQALSGANEELPKLSELAQKNLSVLNDAIQAFENTMVNIDSLVSPGSATTYQLNKALRELTLASRAIQELANMLDRQPESLLRGKQEDMQ
ncbi:MAG: MlaD family protein [Halieaceae bacterium]|jgi:paraquat-inducible protein B|nr:MlaD family protein [Halieaceae bacterium]